MDIDRELMIEQVCESCCPICSLLKKFEFNLMANFQWDVGVKNNQQVEKMIEEQGFCNHHFYMLFRMSNPQHLSKFLLRYIDDFIQHRLALPELSERDCTVCEQVDHQTGEFIQEFSRLYQSEDSFREKFHDNAWLCLPHLEQVIAITMDQNLKAELLQHHKKVMNEFATTMRSFINKRYTEAEGEERQSPIQTIQLMAGFHGTRWSK